MLEMVATGSSRLGSRKATLILDKAELRNQDADELVDQRAMINLSKGDEILLEGIPKKIWVFLCLWG